MKYVRLVLPSPSSVPRTRSSTKVKSHGTPAPYCPTLALVPIILLSVSMNLTPLGGSYIWNHTEFFLLCLAYYTQLNVFIVQTCCSVCQMFFLFKDE